MSEASDTAVPQLHPDNWHKFTPDDDEHGKIEAVRWATRMVFHDADWSKWHATDGSAGFTACGRPIIPFIVDGSPEFGLPDRIRCKHCLAAMKRLGVTP